MADASGDDDKQKLEQAFASIEDGNSKEKANKFWEATSAFFKSSQLLNELATAPQTNPADTTDDSADADEAEEITPSVDTNEKEKIRALYMQQANEYFYRARQAFVKSMKQESDQDHQHGSNGEQEGYKYQSESLSDDQAQERLIMFASLFSREEDVQMINGKGEEAEDVPVTQQQLSLEERLLQLNNSLPSGFKTSDERMRDINRGLNRLGLSSIQGSNSTPTHQTAFSMDLASKQESNKSEVEQVEDIIAQAKDEVAMMQQQEHQEQSTDGGNDKNAGDGTVAGPSIDDVFLDDAGDSDLDDSELDDDEVDIPKEQIELIREKINAAQSSLAQLNALLSAGDDEEQDVTFDQNTGKKALRDARVLLQQATDRWRANMD